MNIVGKSLKAVEIGRNYPSNRQKGNFWKKQDWLANEWQQILTLHLSNSVSDELAVIFLARKLEQRSAIPEETEELQVRKLSFEEAYQMVERSEITDAMSVRGHFKSKVDAS